MVQYMIKRHRYRKLKKHILKIGSVKKYKGYISSGATLLTENCDILIPAALKE